MALAPKISIITPSFNQGTYIEQTILSVLEQDYPNIEYIIIDGGSRDNTVEIIEKYEQKISYWVSEKDKGQTDAINKGLKRATGDIIAFINSDDYYEPGTFRKVAAAYEKGYDWIIGSVRNFKEATHEVEIIRQECNDRLLDWLIRKNKNHQPGNFWSARLMKDVGFLNEDMHYSFDWEYWVRFVIKGYRPIVFNDELFTHFRLHETSKTVHNWRNFNPEYIAIMDRYKGVLTPPEARVVKAEITRLQLEDNIHFARIASIHGRFAESWRLFMGAIRMKPLVVLSPKFLFEMMKALLYMPVRRLV